MSKYINFFKRHLTTLETSDTVFFSYTISGEIEFMNTADGIGINSPQLKGNYGEYDIDLEIPQVNDYDRGYPNITALAFAGFKHKGKYNPDSCLQNKIDFSYMTLSLLYAIRFEATKKLLILNPKQADNYIAEYPNIDLARFIADTLKQFCK